MSIYLYIYFFKLKDKRKKITLLKSVKWKQGCSENKLYTVALFGTLETSNTGDFTIMLMFSVTTLDAFTAAVEADRKNKYDLSAG